MKKTLNISLENSDPIYEFTLDDIDINDAVLAIEELNQSMYKFKEESRLIITDMSIVQESIDNVNELNKISKILKNTLDSGEGMSGSAAKMTYIAIESICGNIGIDTKNTMPSLESYDTNITSLSSTNIALEFINEWIKDSWSAINSFIGGAFSRMRNFFKAIYDVYQLLENRINQLIRKTEVMIRSDKIYIIDEGQKVQVKSLRKFMNGRQISAATLINDLVKIHEDIFKVDSEVIKGFKSNADNLLEIMYKVFSKEEYASILLENKSNKRYVKSIQDVLKSTPLPVYKMKKEIREVDSNGRKIITNYYGPLPNFTLFSAESHELEYGFVKSFINKITIPKRDRLFSDNENYILTPNLRDIHENLKNLRVLVSNLREHNNRGLKRYLDLIVIYEKIFNVSPKTDFPYKRVHKNVFLEMDKVIRGDFSSIMMIETLSSETLLSSVKAGLAAINQNLISFKKKTKQS